MDQSIIINNLFRNQNIFEHLLQGISETEYLWKPAPDKWCLLEIVCHLYDEEQYDFKARVNHILNNSKGDPPEIDPVGWASSRKYIEQNYEEILGKFLKERASSVEWLRSLKDPEWKNEYSHPKFGAMSAEFFLTNWLAHDYLHFRQITALKYNYLKHVTGIDLRYAGEW